MKTILVTGGAGFIGSNFIGYFLNKYPDYKIINLDKLTYAGDKANLSSVLNNKNHVFIQGDITNPALLNDLFGQYKITDIIHFAAESHVDNSILDPSIFIQTNVMGTYQLLQAARNYWPKDTSLANRFFHISTDEVYGSLGLDGGVFTEESPYQPNSPYSASKAASDHLVRSYFKTYGLNTCISNCSNNFGPNQHDEKLIPTIIRNLLQEKPVPIYGTGKNVRDWIFVEDHCKAIDTIFHQAKPGSHYNIGGDCELTNIKILEVIAGLLGLKFDFEKMVKYVPDRLGHDLRYAISNSKINQELNWHPSDNLAQNLKNTIEFYIRKYKFVT
jgi:dTDP-glucose 4,6-dehydratase